MLVEWSAQVYSYHEMFFIGTSFGKMWFPSSHPLILEQWLHVCKWMSNSVVKNFHMVRLHPYVLFNQYEQIPHHHFYNHSLYSIIPKEENVCKYFPAVVICLSFFKRLLVFSKLLSTRKVTYIQSIALVTDNSWFN